jgi:hypothetical protein
LSGSAKTQTHRQHGDFISLLSFFKTEKNATMCNSSKKNGGKLYTVGASSNVKADKHREKSRRNIYVPDVIYFFYTDLFLQFMTLLQSITFRVLA